jgi:hypothetical protein
VVGPVVRRVVAIVAAIVLVAFASSTSLASAPSAGDGRLQRATAGDRPAASTQHPTTVPDGTTPAYAWAWVTVRRTGNGTYTPKSKYQGNSAGLQNQVTVAAHGHISVMFNGVHGFSTTNGGGGVLQVTPLDTDHVCSVGEWYRANGTSIFAFVRCYTADGTPAASQVAISYLAAKNGTGWLGYAWLDGRYVGNIANYMESYDSKSTSTITFARSSTGHYTVTFPGLAGALGLAEASSIVGTGEQGGIPLNPNGPAICDVSSQGPAGADEQIGVVCRDTHGNPENTQFIVSFTQNQGLKGTGNGKVAYLWNTSPTVQHYIAGPHAFSSVGMQTEVTHTSTGQYDVLFDGMPLGGAALVTADASIDVQCELSGLLHVTAGQTVKVHCTDANGLPFDTSFAVSYER